MSASAQTSIIIPVYNKWELTANCLRSLRTTLPDGSCEIIVVDNASTDATPGACPALGGELFGSLFVYRREENNRNFGPASNLGARMGRGEFLLFLNNDTIAQPGWYEPLLRDFSAYSDLAATGPVLLYPPRGPLGAAVQHLGVFVTPSMKVGHLYEGIPADSELARKRRFFQIITAACMLMPRALFLEHGGFDEAYVNGVEDVDLCARLWSAGCRMTVNPASRMFHLAGQTPGRHSHESENARHLEKTSLQHLVPDWHMHLQNDGLELRLSPWQTLVPQLPEEQKKRLSALLDADDPAALVALLHKYPLWHAGYERLADLFARRGDTVGEHAVRLSVAKLSPLPDQLFALLGSARKAGESQSADFALGNLFQYCFAVERFMENALSMRKWVADIGLGDLAGQYEVWLQEAEGFRQSLYLPFLGKMSKMTASFDSPSLAG